MIRAENVGVPRPARNARRNLYSNGVIKAIAVSCIKRDRLNREGVTKRRDRQMKTMKSLLLILSVMAVLTAFQKTTNAQIVLSEAEPGTAISLGVPGECQAVSGISEVSGALLPTKGTTVAFRSNPTPTSASFSCFTCSEPCVQDMNTLMQECDQSNPTRDCYTKAQRYYVLCMRVLCPQC